MGQSRKRRTALGSITFCTWHLPETRVVVPTSDKQQGSEWWPLKARGGDQGPERAMNEQITQESGAKTFFARGVRASGPFLNTVSPHSLPLKIYFLAALSPFVIFYLDFGNS